MPAPVLAPLSTALPADLLQALETARKTAHAAGLAHAGGLPPVEAWRLMQAGAAILVDVRSPEEYRFVGHVPDSLNVPWASGTSLTRNPRFVRELEARLNGRKEAPVLLLCRSGKRSVLAAEAAAKAGFTTVYNVLEGFEGDLDALGQRGHGNGWRFHQLPWLQD
ncbi:MAG TPA: rhodanese-like domain-containing protein [Roseateles sp.]|nr:rhodanese-like domain-containing protein [Roseateles sp.]